ncbi:MAG: valine--tRNA ligase [Nitrospira sp.]|nr:valine--tRNA ligase [Nitrospira sp.]MDH4368842.1 valine--tRNA ligase [Nitrospira sp.]MDH5347948.1 valine--tRNA ligase [Nitrospira sp.]MDH5496213.1 valine--tRNA ligase [Nitrospira sp.]MDH5724108.1 valine--tRNA ligase [Nitrospira sp.]
MASFQLDKTYDPKTVEARWSQEWIAQGYFRASPEHPGQPYSIVIPPPNVTGSLHVGHALNHSLQDILIRWRRMQGRNTLWLPGTDHAGIATQNVVEKHVMAEGASRESLGREQFIERVWQWKATSGNTIINQQKQLGESCDWDRLRFTMDEGLSKAVLEVFVRLYEDGLIYRGERLINWCPRCLTALSDIEVEHEDVKGKLYSIHYPLEDDPSTRLTVATTRPETMFGDTAVAVHPEDDRFKHLIGKRLRLPLTSRTIPIVGDGILVDREFGTGAVKITPAHDFSDYEAGERHALPRLAILDHHALLDAANLQKAGVDQATIDLLHGLPVPKARPKVEELLKERGLLEKVEDHKMAVGKCYRCKTVVEPSLSPQWFVNIKPLADPAITAVEHGRIRIIPEGWTNNYLGWMRDIKDWCISRQIWWGHQIPAWYCLSCNADHIIRTGDRLAILQGASPIVSETAPAKCPACRGDELYRDPDVLDTWFSSSLWPFSTLGWPEHTQELKTYYPTSVLVTGLDILFFWVARMIMMGLKFMGEVPFRDVYIHALVRDAEGKKMSKSKGNVIDPLHVMSEFGTDALRFTLASMASPGRDVKLAEERIEGYRNFANKIWNAARFAHMYLDGPRVTLPISQRTIPDRWILSRLNHTINTVTVELESYRFDRASNALYHFIWHEFCDWYLELIKPVLQTSDHPDGPSTRETLVQLLETTMRLLHPFMPFITEEIWQTIPHHGHSIVTQAYPMDEPSWDSCEAEHLFALIEQTVNLARTGRVLLNYPPAQPIMLYVAHEDSTKQDLLCRVIPHVAHLGRGTAETIANSAWPAQQLLRLVAEGLSVGINVSGDVDLQKAVDRLDKQLSEVAKESQRLNGKLDNPDFVSKAPPEVIADHQDRLRALAQDYSMLISSEQQLQSMLGQ